MKKSSICIKLSLLVIISAYFHASAVNTRLIEQVRNKQVLTSSELETIDNFIKMAADELVNSTDFTEAARLRAQITGMQSTQSQYRQQFSKSCKKYLAQAMQKAQEKDKDISHKIRVNLMILVSELNDPGLIDIALAATEDSDKAVQYWAVRALTKEQFINNLRTIGADSTINSIAVTLQKVIGKIEPYAAQHIVDFAALENNDATEELFLKLTDLRIADYEKNRAIGDVIDMKILKLLCTKMLAKKQQAANFGPRFCQLYSYIFQRYINYLKDQNDQKPKDARMLASILIEIEDKCIGKLTGLKQGVIKDSIKKDSYGALELEHSRLLGDQSRKGEIPEKFNFNYGQNSDGTIRTWPKALTGKRVDG